MEKNRFEAKSLVSGFMHVGFALGAAGLAYGVYQNTQGNNYAGAAQEAARHWLTQPGHAAELRAVANHHFEISDVAYFSAFVLLAAVLAAGVLARFIPQNVDVKK